MKINPFVTEYVYASSYAPSVIHQLLAKNVYKCFLQQFIIIAIIYVKTIQVIE